MKGAVTGGGNGWCLRAKLGTTAQIQGSVDKPSMSLLPSYMRWLCREVMHGRLSVRHSTWMMV